MNTGRSTPIRVVIADDSPIALNLIARIFAVDPDFEVVATVSDGLEALKMVTRLQPDLLCTDLHMPRMDGLALTRRVMAECPLPILVVSVSVFADKTQNVFQLLEAGAVDVFPKPLGGFRLDAPEAVALRKRARIVAGVHVARRLAREYSPSLSPVFQDACPRIVVIGASTGGPMALRELLEVLPADFPAPILCVQHISPGFLPALVSWLDASLSLAVRIAGAAQRPRPGEIYFAPDCYHLSVAGTGLMELVDEPPVNDHRPSIDVLFRSVASYARESVAAVLLTGMGRDGAEGMAAIAHAGGKTFAQDEASSVVYGMPREAVALNVVQRQLPPKEIGLLLARLYEREQDSASGNSVHGISPQWSRGEQKEIADE